MEFHGQSGMDVFEALQEVSEKKRLPMKVIVSAIWAGIKGEYEFQGRGMDCPSFKKIGEECQAHGFAECLTYALIFLPKTVASDKDIKKLEGALESPPK